jgi:hypothetical protein
MSICFLTLLTLMGDTPHLELTVNRSEIQAYDFVIVKSVVSNKSESAVFVEHKVAGPAIQFEIKRGDTWTPLRGMDMRKMHGSLSAGGPPLLDVGGRYAEFNVILVDGKDQFVFERPGRFELRAEVQLSGKRFESKPVTITVKARDSSMVNRIKKAGIGVGAIGSWLNRDPLLSDQLVALEDVGGNIGAGVKNKLLMQRIISGEERTGDDVIKYVRDRMDPLDAEISLAILGEHYFRKQDWPNLAKVAAEFRENSWITFSWQASLDFHALKEPLLVVPPEPAKKP